MTLPTLHHRRCDSPLGPLWLSASERGLCGLWFLDQKHLPPWLSADATPCADDAVLIETTRQLDDYFAGRRRNFDLPLDLQATGTPFQQAVWQALRDIAPGATISYGELGRRLDKPGAVRAVGAAVGRNPIGIIVPCHRVVGADGSLTGYAGGLHRKAALLRLEQPASHFVLT